jgi:hypothetical protein
LVELRRHAIATIAPMMAPGIAPDTAPPKPATPKKDPMMPPMSKGQKYPASAKPRQKMRAIPPSRNSMDFYFTNGQTRE